MSTSLTHTQIRSVIAGDKPYQVADTVTSSVNIAPQVFVFSVTDDSFVQVAGVKDMSDYPITKNDAITANKTKYRQSSVTVAWADVTAAQRFGATLIDRMQSLVDDYQKATNSFAGTTSGTVTSG